MAKLTRRVALDLPSESAFEACLRLLTDADPARGVVQRQCTPYPPREGSHLLTVVRDRRGERTLRARVVELDPPRTVATAADDEGPAVRTSLAVEAVGDHSVVTFTSDATTALGVIVRATGLIDHFLLMRSQRRAARQTLRRLRELAAIPGFRTPTSTLHRDSPTDVIG
jgi:hypothetical protein